MAAVCQISGRYRSGIACCLTSESISLPSVARLANSEAVCSRLIRGVRGLKSSDFTIGHYRCTVGPMKPIRISDVLELPVTERLKLVEAIWDSIAEAPEALQLTEAQRTELDRRLDEYEKDPEAGSPWTEVRERILKRS